jgi:hypothetical protein
MPQAPGGVERPMRMAVAEYWIRAPEELFEKFDEQHAGTAASRGAVKFKQIGEKA